MSESYWFRSVGPFDENQVGEWADGLRNLSSDATHIEVIDVGQWYARAWDVDSVRAALVAFKAGLTVPGVSEDDRLTIAGLVSDMETWLKQESDFRSE